MKIVIIRHSIRNRGGDRLILDYCASLIAQGHSITYWTNEINTQFPIDPKILIKKIPWPGVLGTILFTLFRKFKDDIVLVDLVIMSVLAGFFKNQKVVYLAQDDDRTYYTSKILKTITHWLYKLSLRYLKTPVICVSEYLATQLSQYSPQRIFTVSNGIDTKIFYKENPSSYLNKKKTKAAIILYARSDYRKGLDTGIKAVEELNRIRGSHDWELWIIGESAINININGLKIMNWGFLKDAELRAVLSAADIYLSPSRHEGFGLMQLEAMACGCAMITTEAFPLVKNEINGLVSPIENWEALAKNCDRIINNPELKNSLIKNGYLLAEQFDIQKSQKRFEETLKKLI